jgi:hypothetical protein
MPKHTLNDKQLIENVRALLAERKRLRWYRLAFGVALLVLYISGTLEVVHRLEKQDSLQPTRGFLIGMALAFFFTTFGLFGAILLAKSRSGFQNAMRSQKLLVTYHDRLRELHELPEVSNTENAREAAPGPKHLTGD